MKRNPETILDTSIEELRNGRSVESVLEAHAEELPELADLLPMLSSLATLPKAGAPIPYKRHLYAEQLKPRSAFGKILSFLKASALPAGIIAGLSTFIITGYAANNSIPGQHLFTVKKSIERTTLVFTPESAKPQAKLAIIEKRLAEAQHALADPRTNPKNTQAALVELASQTQETLSDVKAAADNNTLTSADVDVLNSLAEITKIQENLTNDTNPATEEVAEITAEVAKEAKLASQEINRIIATVNDQTLASLNTDPNDITIAGGLITSIDKSKVIVEKTVFNFDPNKIIIVKDEQSFDINKLVAQTKVTISGTKTSTGIIVKKIIVLELPPLPAGTVKGETTKPVEVIEPETEIPTEPETLEPNNNVTGTFIVE